MDKQYIGDHEMLSSKGSKCHLRKIHGLVESDVKNEVWIILILF